jgi:hypothetical protein
MYTILNLILAFLRLAITPVKIGPRSLTDSIPGQMGAQIDYGLAATVVSNLSNNSSPAFGNWSSTIIPNARTADTYNAQELVGGIIRRFTPGAAFTDCTPTATNIVNAIPGAVVGQSFLSIIANLGSGIETIGAGTGVTLIGTTTIASNATGLFLGKVLSSTTVSFNRLFVWGNGTGFTALSGL